MERGGCLLPIIAICVVAAVGMIFMEAIKALGEAYHKNSGGVIAGFLITAGLLYLIYKVMNEK